MLSAGELDTRHVCSLGFQAALLATLDKDCFEQPGVNQAMWFGSLPLWAEELMMSLPVQSLPSEVGALFPSGQALKTRCLPLTCLHLGQIRTRRPLFNQLAINLYSPGEGLKPHIDLPHR